MYILWEEEDQPEAVDMNRNDASSEAVGLVRRWWLSTRKLEPILADDDRSGHLQAQPAA